RRHTRWPRDWSSDVCSSDLRSLAFVVGLSLVFTLLGASASAAGRVLLQHQVIILRVAGVLVVILGLHTLGLIRIPLLYREKRLRSEERRVGKEGRLGLGGVD